MFLLWSSLVARIYPILMCCHDNILIKVFVYGGYCCVIGLSMIII